LTVLLSTTKPTTTSNPPKVNLVSTNENPLDDATIEQGDEHTTTASMMSLEHPEAVISVAPAEGQRPLFIMTDPNFETMPCLTLTNFALVVEHSALRDLARKLTYRKYFRC
jgi:hypothetical protein